jgi:hypothetical protein
LPALLVAGAFALPLVTRTVEWLGLPRELRVALPLLLGVAALAGVEQSRRSAADDLEAQDEAGQATVGKVKAGKVKAGKVKPGEGPTAAEAE